MNTEKPTIHIWIGALICCLYVTLGAFGAHGLKSSLSDLQLDIYGTGLRYMIIHGLALILINLVYIVLNKYSKWSNYLIYAGLVFFSVSLIIHATKDLIGIDTMVFAKFAPIGGLCFVASWIIFALKIKSK
jgi:uncharacterized membrane protein YgdD (TMEM256/DUF423 family)